MTEDEAKTICEILATADGGCRNCVKSLSERFQKAFPELSKKAVAHWVFPDKSDDNLRKELLEEMADTED